MPWRHVHQHPWFLHLWELQAWIWTFCWWTEMWRFGWCKPGWNLELSCHIWFFSASLLLDVDECAQANFCLGGVCANTEGSYSCTRCKAGYRVSPDRQRCEGRSHLLSPLNKNQLAHQCSQLIVKIPALWNQIPSHFMIFLKWYSCRSACVFHRYRWVPVFGYVCQWDLPKLRGLVYLWELPCRVQSIIWWRALWR